MSKKSMSQGRRLWSQLDVGVDVKKFKPVKFDELGPERGLR